MRLAFLVLAPILMLAGCGGGGGKDAPTAPANSVKTVAAPAGTTWVDHVEKTANGGFRMGNPDAPLKLIEYGARTCPACAAFDLQGFEPLKSKYVATGKVSYEFRDYPVHGPLDLGPILVGQCVEPEAFFPLLNQMFQDQPKLLAKEEAVIQMLQSSPNLTPNQVATTVAEQLGYIDYVKQRGVPEVKVRACLADSATITTLSANTQKANDTYQINHTPSFILNEHMLDDVGSWDDLDAALKKAGA